MNVLCCFEEKVREKKTQLAFKTHYSFCAWVASLNDWNHPELVRKSGGLTQFTKKKQEQRMFHQV